MSELTSMRIELQYLPNVAYFMACLKYGEVWLEAHEHYQKQSYRNRCHILTANGPSTLTVPIQHEGKKILIKDVKIDGGQKWTLQHWRSLVAAYAKAPYFEYFADYFDQVYKKNPVFLFDLNHNLLTTALKLLQINPTIHQTQAYQVQVPCGQFDARELIHPKKILVNKLWKGQNRYKQNFGNGFEANLSIIDVLMCQGPKARYFLQTTSAPICQKNEE